MSRTLRTARAEIAATLGFISFSVCTRTYVDVNGSALPPSGVNGLALPTSGGDADVCGFAGGAVAETGDAAVVGG